MQIDFFEEYPSRETLSGLVSLGPVTVFLASHSYDEFLSHKDLLREVNPRATAAWWPLLKTSYWLSSFSDPHEVENVFEILKNRTDKSPLEVLIDLELPILRGKRDLFWKHLKYLGRNKRAIRTFLQTAHIYNVQPVTAEYPPVSILPWRFWLRLLGIAYRDAAYARSFMFYTSMIPRRMLEKGRLRIAHAVHSKPNTIIGLGTIATGVLETEPILSPEDLDKDLVWAQSVGCKRVIIFRAGGLAANPAYESVIRRRQS